MTEIRDGETFLIRHEQGEFPPGSGFVLAPYRAVYPTVPRSPRYSFKTIFARYIRCCGIICIWRRGKFPEFEWENDYNRRPFLDTGVTTILDAGWGHVNKNGRRYRNFQVDPTIYATIKLNG